MNAPEKIAFLPDIQAQVDHRDLRIDAVGIKGVRHPITIRTAAGVQPTVATFSMTVELPPAAKGTHMSRFIELLQTQTDALDADRFGTMLIDMLQRLGARSGIIEMRFPYFVMKAAPVSGARSMLDYQVCWRARVSKLTGSSLSMQVIVPVTSLCPCSKEISEYGAHNQRSHIRIDAELAGKMTIDELIAIAERSGSCEIYGLLKRQDEKYVTERAYENPKFVEDIVRDAALALNRDVRIAGYIVEAENFESIHNHSAFARIARPRNMTEENACRH